MLISDFQHTVIGEFVTEHFLQERKDEDPRLLTTPVITFQITQIDLYGQDMYTVNVAQNLQPRGQIDSKLAVTTIPRSIVSRKKSAYEEIADENYL